MKNNVKNLVEHAEVSEKAIERYLAEVIEGMGGLCLKYSNPNMVGYPDRICLLPDGVTLWFELKSNGETLTAIQRIRIYKMRELGHVVFVCGSKKAIDESLEPYKVSKA